MELRVEDVVSRAQDEVVQRSRNEREIFEVSVTVSDRVVEDDEPKQLLDLDGVGPAILFQGFSEFLVAAVVLVVFAVALAGAVRQLTEVFLAALSPVAGSRSKRFTM